MIELELMPCNGMSWETMNDDTAHRHTALEILSQSKSISRCDRQHSAALPGIIVKVPAMPLSHLCIVLITGYFLNFLGHHILQFAPSSARTATTSQLSHVQLSPLRARVSGGHEASVTVKKQSLREEGSRGISLVQPSP